MFELIVDQAICPMRIGNLGHLAANSQGAFGTAVKYCKTPFPAAGNESGKRAARRAKWEIAAQRLS